MILDSEKILGELHALRNECETFRAENAAQRYERDALRDKWESVPWDGLREATQLLRTYEDLIPSASIECLTDDLAEWIEDHAPKEAARAADVPMLRRMIDGQHKVASERIEEIVRLSSELRDLRAKWEAVPWQALLWSVSGAASVYAAPAEDINTALDWIRANAPQQSAK